MEGDGGWKAGFDGEGSFWWLSLGRGFGCLFFGPRFSSAFFFLLRFMVCIDGVERVEHGIVLRSIIIDKVGPGVNSCCSL